MSHMMSESFAENITDNIIRYLDLVSDVLKDNRKACYYGAGAVVVTLVSCAVGKDVKQRIFVWMNKNSEKIVGKQDYRARVFEPLKGLESHDKDLREQKSIRILEIGVGCGFNFQYYPDGSHLVLVDPNPHFKQQFIERVAGTGLKLDPNDVVTARGEDMDEVPNESIDAVVVTRVLCSVTDVAKVVKQAKRVLAPGGKFLFMEHVHDWDKKNWKRRLLQSLLTVSRIWPFLFEGCTLNRDPMPVIREAGFKQLDHEYFYADILWPVFKELCSPTVRGVATK